MERISLCYHTIRAYSDTLHDDHARNAFYYYYSLAKSEYIMETNKGGGLPIVGSYEMKQDVYDTSRYIHSGI